MIKLKIGVKELIFNEALSRDVVLGFSDHYKREVPEQEVSHLWFKDNWYIDDSDWERFLFSDVKPFLMPTVKFCIKISGRWCSHCHEQVKEKQKEIFLLPSSNRYEITFN